jgi:hypothetical protein
MPLIIDSLPVSGEFYLVATPVWKIKKGEIVHCAETLCYLETFLSSLKTLAKVEQHAADRVVMPSWIKVENV